jgi:CRISPR-associated protein (TIGR03984 family)
MNSTTTLYTWTKGAVTFTAAMQAVAQTLGGNLVGLFYSPQTCQFGLYCNGAFLDEAAKSLRLSYVYEARVFTEQGELRWWNDPATGFGQGQAAYLSEAQRPPDGWPDCPAVRHEVVRWPNHYLLWGEGWDTNTRTLAAGWSRLAAGRIGTLPVPFGGLQPKERLQLSTVEYFGQAPGLAGEHGNVVVVEERLVKLEKYALP